MADSSPWWRRRPGRPGDTPPGAAEIAAPASPSGDATPAPAGRLSSPRGERTKTIAVRLTPEEHAAWQAAATADGRSQMGRWVRETITDRLAGRQGPKQIEGLKELRSDLSHAGSNLNQIARALNVAQRGGGDPPELRVVAEVIDATRAELARVRNSLQERS
jgi:hypothetical protein